VDKHALTLLALAEDLGSAGDGVFLSSSQLGKTLGVSQQTASRRLKELEDAGLITRRRVGRRSEVKLTGKGTARLKKVSELLGRVLRRKGGSVTLRGRVVTGLGEGAYYVLRYASRIKRVLGFTPYPGTLNLAPEESLGDLAGYAKATIDAFTEEGRSYGRVFIIPVEISGGKDRLNCYVILPERTHHTDQIEIISSYHLRERLGLAEGDLVCLRIIN